MNTLQPGYVSNVSMITPVGLSALATAMALRAGIARFQRSSFFNMCGEPITLACVPPGRWCEEPLDAPNVRSEADEYADRIERLGIEALTQCMQGATRSASRPTFWVGAEPQEQLQARSAAQVLDRLAQRFGSCIDRAQSRVFEEGRAGGAAAVQAALALLAQDSTEEVLVVGVDSYHHKGRLKKLDADLRLPGWGAGDSMVLGEAAACLLLSRDSAGAMAQVCGCGVASEAAHRHSDEPCLGNGLSEAVRQALATQTVKPIRTVYGTLNGESRQAKEWGIAYLRNQRAFDRVCEQHHPADCIGDIGAASLPLLMGLGAIAAHRGQRPQPTLIWAASEYTARGAVIVS